MVVMFQFLMVIRTTVEALPGKNKHFILKSAAVNLELLFLWLFNKLIAENYLHITYFVLSIAISLQKL